LRCLTAGFQFGEDLLGDFLQGFEDADALEATASVIVSFLRRSSVVSRSMGRMLGRSRLLSWSTRARLFII